jgi:hypothetical protein
MPQLDDLHLHEQLLLLALHDEKGTMQGANFEFGAGAAVLAELLLAGHLALEQVKKKRFVKVVNATLPGDPIVDEALLRIRTARRAEQPATWVRRIAGTKRLRHRIADRLRYRGILGKREGRVLLIFSRDLYPTTNPLPERELVERIRQAVLGDEPVAPHTAIMIALAEQIGLLHPVLTRQERKARIRRLKQLATLEAVDERARAAIKGLKDVIEANAAVHAAVVASG